jgi:sugar/nucleoside kinase (ribokinase family)
MVNDSEARELSGDWNIHRAGRWILRQGPKRVVIKQGEHGALLIEPRRTFYVPAYPLENVFDPTGAGDAFAGGFMAYLARTRSVAEDNVRRAMVYGAAWARTPWSSSEFAASTESPWRTWSSECGPSRI